MDTQLCIHVLFCLMLSKNCKNVGIRIRIEAELRDVFVEACHAQQSSASDVLREFMRVYAAQHHYGKQASLFSAKSDKKNKPLRGKQ